MTFGVIPTGFSIKDQATIRAEMEARAKELLGQLLNTSNTSAYGHILTIQAEQLAELWEANQAIYAASDLGSATGRALEIIGDRFLLSKLVAAPAVGQVTFTATNDATVPAGTIISVQGDPDRRFQTTSELNIVFSTSATGTVGVVALENGKTVVPPNLLTVLESTLPNIASVTNVDNIDDGRLLETDAEFRLRIQQSRATPGSSTQGAIQSAVAAINSVDSVTVLQNRTGDVDSAGIPRNSIEVIVEGADDAATENAVAQAIYDNVAAGIGIYSHDSSSGTAVDANSGQAVTIPFTKPTEVQLEITADLTTANAYQGDAAAQQAVVDYVATLALGEDLTISKLACVLSDLEGVTDVTDVGFRLTSSGGAYQYSNRNSDFRDKQVVTALEVL